MERRVTVARAVAAGLVFVTASYHLWWGFPRSLIYLQGLDSLLSQGLPPDPRPFLFVGFAAVLLAGPYLVTRDVISLRRAYQLGIVLMTLSILAWIGWHEGGHGAVLTGAPAPEPDSHSHGGVLYTIYDHYVTTPTEGIIKTTEFLAATLFGWLRWRDPAVNEEQRDATVETEHTTSE